MAINEQEFIQIWERLEKIATVTERERILALVNKEIERLEEGGHWVNDAYLRGGGKALRYLKELIIEAFNE